MQSALKLPPEQVLADSHAVLVDVIKLPRAGLHVGLEIIQVGFRECCQVTELHGLSMNPPRSKSS
jgi:hypothetical protein